MIFAQSTTGKIVGTVSTADGAVAGATFVVTDNQIKLSLLLLTAKTANDKSGKLI